MNAFNFIDEKIKDIKTENEFRYVCMGVRDLAIYLEQYASIKVKECMSEEQEKRPEDFQRENDYWWNRTKF